MGIPQHGAQTGEFIIDHGKVPLRRESSITRQRPTGYTRLWGCKFSPIASPLKRKPKLRRICNGHPTLAATAWIALSDIYRCS